MRHTVQWSHAGGNTVLVAAVLIWSVATLATTWGYRWLPLLLACRAMVGLHPDARDWFKIISF